MHNDPTFTNASIAPRPRNEAIKVKAPVKRMALLGVSDFSLTIPNDFDINLPRPSAKRTLDPARKNPFQLVNNPRSAAIKTSLVKSGLEKRF